MDCSSLYWQGPPTGGRATHRGVRLGVEHGEAVHHVKKPRIISAPFLGNRRPGHTNHIDNNPIAASSPSNPHDCGRSISNRSSSRFSNRDRGASDAHSSRSNTFCALRSNSRLQSVGLPIPGREWFFILNSYVCISLLDINKIGKIYRDTLLLSTLQINFSTLLPRDPWFTRTELLTHH